MRNLFILIGAAVEIQTETLKSITRKLANPIYVQVALELRNEVMEALVTSGVKSRFCEYETAAKELEIAVKAFGKALTKGTKPSVTVTEAVES